ncbi:hypothetical protein FNV43_RR26088 [Rhamnella rubrinervis]|uniref:Uncharacterized protein n=1 Tax=Rhamnella rubrinervis TaxID=2594499 RepID=A0A8K0DHZ3_9ROSA|nr:hypothetical protein FNV43_RR26088 [Rhamnella rubrinervis]
MPPAMKHKKKKSTLCEKSMLLVANIINMSAIPLARISAFGASTVYKLPAAKKRGIRASTGAEVTSTTTALLAPQRPRRQRTTSSSEPEEISGSRSVPHKDGPSHKDIDARASDFIRRIRENNLNASNPAQTI